MLTNKGADNTWFCQWHGSEVGHRPSSEEAGNGLQRRPFGIYGGRSE